jgi:hypothetical protein
MNYFYSKEIILLTETDGYMDRGVWIEGELTETKTIKCDVQPYSKERLYSDYGFNIDCTYRVFAESDPDITVSKKAKYKDTVYTIVKVIEWDNYIEFIIHEVSQ